MGSGRRGGRLRDMNSSPISSRFALTGSLHLGRRNAQAGAIPVLSCEGPCIRGEIARLAANRLGHAPGYRRACHGELFAVPNSAMASWVRNAREVVVIDGCHLKCHARIVEHLVDPKRLRSFDALARYRKNGDLFDVDSVPETERRTVADDVAQWVLQRLQQSTADPTPLGNGVVSKAFIFPLHWRRDRGVRSG